MLYLQLALDQETSTLKASVLALQAGLENSEQVQKDFVKLSQNLQVIHRLWLVILNCFHT